MGEYKNENLFKSGKKWVNVRMEISLNFGL